MKNYVIIGGSSGIGKAIVHQLSSEGNCVFTTYHTNDENDTLENTTYHHYEVGTSELNFDFLPETIDGFVYCPGSINLLPFARIKAQDFRNDFDLQVVGAIETLQHILPRLKKAENASIVFFSTVAVQTGFNFHTQVAVSKGAIEGLTRSLAAELSPKMRVNAIAPSLTDTKLASKMLSSDEKKEANAQRHPLKKIGEPEDIAEMACFLLSDKSKWMTGQILAVDGGMSSVKL
jgi:NAD(P)-dependent dehydrogenase (short-subunit alcohol dehydrogenase family)